MKGSPSITKWKHRTTLPCDWRILHFYNENTSTSQTLDTAHNNNESGGRRGRTWNRARARFFIAKDSFIKFIFTIFPFRAGSFSLAFFFFISPLQYNDVSLARARARTKILIKRFSISGKSFVPARPELSGRYICKLHKTSLPLSLSAAEISDFAIAGVGRRRKKKKRTGGGFVQICVFYEPASQKNQCPWRVARRACCSAGMGFGCRARAGRWMNLSRAQI